MQVEHEPLEDGTSEDLLALIVGEFPNSADFVVLPAAVFQKLMTDAEGAGLTLDAPLTVAYFQLAE